MLLVSLQLGQPKTYGSGSDAWTSAIAKHPVCGPVWLHAENLAGDAQADRKNHGGVHKAVLAYAAAHYPLWARELGRELSRGGFGENFTVQGADETTVCIGDVWEVGGALLQVSQPREPCRNPPRYWHLDDLDQRMRDTGRTGWYFRVLQEGEVAAGQTIVLRERSCPAWTVARANDVLYRRVPDLAAARAALAACPHLSPRWRARFTTPVKS